MEHATTAHPALQLIPPLTPEQQRSLDDDVKANGQLVACYRQDGKLLDGRGRELACMRADVEPFYIEVASTVNAVAFVASLNLHRRDLPWATKLVILAKMAKMQTGRPRKEARNGLFSNAQAAELGDASRATMVNVKRVVDKGVPELVAAMEAHHISPTHAGELASKPADKQRELLAKYVKEPKRSTGLALIRESRTLARASTAQRLPDADFEALKALRNFGLTGKPQVRAGVKVLERIVPAVAA